MEKLEREGKRYLLPLIESWKEKATEDVADNAVNLWIDTIRQSINQSTKYAEVLAQWKKDLETRMITSDKHSRKITKAKLIL